LTAAGGTVILVAVKAPVVGRGRSTMPTLQGLSDGDEVPRVLDVEPHGRDIILRVHTGSGSQSGQDILLLRGELEAAVRRGVGRVEGVSPVRRTPKVCEVERRPEGVRFQIHPASGKGSWWVVVPAAAVDAVLFPDGNQTGAATAGSD
jgi:hypothetical protein